MHSPALTLDPSLLLAAQSVRIVFFDVDGVLTDGGLLYTESGETIKRFNTLDGHGLKLLQKSGVRLAIITGRKAPCVEWRMKNLRIDLLLQGVDDKLAALKGLLGELGLSPEEAGFMGDDVIDLQVMDHCGFSAAPANAHALAKQYARLVTERTGGFGAAREVCEFILEAQDKLDAALAPFLPQSHSAAEK